VRMRVKDTVAASLDAYQKPRQPDSLEQTLEDIINSR
jgi:hypothetical protein